MTEVAILTPDPSLAGDAQRWRPAFDRLRDALALHGIAVSAEPWTNHVNNVDGLQRYACVLPLLTWGYHYAPAQWLRACATWQRDAVPFANPASILAWNTNKRYLAELGARGVDVLPTIFTDSPDRTAMDALHDATGAAELIMKPTVSAGSWQTRRLQRGALIDDVGGVEVILQPYLPTIETLGETSLLYFGGRLSHAVNKRPAAGDFRVQEEVGGRYTLIDTPPPEAVALAERTLTAIDAQLLYARIDMLQDSEGRWLLMEAELIEPDFYLDVDPRRGAGFAQALRDMLSTDTKHSDS